MSGFVNCAFCVYNDDDVLILQNKEIRQSLYVSSRYIQPTLKRFVLKDMCLLRPMWFRPRSKEDIREIELLSWNARFKYRFLKTDKQSSRYI